MSATLDVEPVPARFSTTRRRSSAKARASRSTSTTPAATPRRGSSRKWPQRSAPRSREHEGSLLAFLPGVAEIERTAEALGTLPADVDLHKLHGGIDPAAQRAALAPPPAGQAQARPRDQHRRDQRHARGCAHRRRQRPGAPAALRPRRRASPGSSPSARAAPRSPSAPAAPLGRRRASPSGCGKKPRPPRCPRTTRPRSSKPICRACC